MSYAALEIFRSWRLGAAEAVQDAGLTPSFFDSPPSDNPSMRLDIKSDDLEATIVCWQRGSVAVEAYKKSSDTFMPFTRAPVEDDDLEAALAIYLQTILLWASA